ncbi:MAG: prepilin peptidase [Candidatus Gracilibacteria bacterium]
MLIPRLHKGETGIVKGRSHCPNCKTVLRPQDLVPLLSFLALRGRCKSCKKPISWWYPLTELSSGLLLALLYFQVQNWELFAFLVPNFFVLLFIFFYDLRYKEIHDAIMLPAILYAFVANFWIGDIQSAAFGGAIGIGFFGLQYLISRGRWLGSGDIRIGAFMGFMLGWPFTPLAIFMAYILGSTVGIFLLLSKKANGKTAVPLGPFLAAGTVLAFFLGDPILDLYFFALGKLGF